MLKKKQKLDWVLVRLAKIRMNVTNRRDLHAQMGNVLVILISTLMELIAVKFDPILKLFKNVYFFDF